MTHVNYYFAVIVVAVGVLSLIQGLFASRT
jgi:hypothetical protein